MNKIFCTINGKKFQITKNKNYLHELLLSFLNSHNPNLSIAVAVNEELIQKSEWKKKVIEEGDRVEIVQAFFGG